MPSVMAVQSSIADDETDDDVNLDLHISDNDDIEENGTGKSPEDIPMEIEDEILNKFDVENKSETTKEEVSLTNGDDAEGGDVDKEHRDDKTDAEETKESDAVAVNGDATKSDDTEKEEEEEEMKEESVEKEAPTKEEEIKENNKEEITEINIKEIKEKIREEIKKHNDEEKIEEKNEEEEIDEHFEQEEKIEENNEEEKIKENNEAGIKENDAEEKTDEKVGEEEEAKTKPKDDKDNGLTDDDMDLEESEVSTAAENKNEAEAIKLEDASKEKVLKVEQKCEEKKDVKFIENGIEKDEVKDTTKKEHDESIKNKIELVKVEEVRKSEVATEERDKEENDAEDLLLVMDEKTADAENDATKDDDDASNEDSPSDDNLGDNRIEEPMELEDKIDIEEHPADLEMTSEDASMTIEKSINIDEDEDDDVDANKENVDASDGDSSDSRKSVLESILTSPMLKNKKNLDMVTSSKSSKRLLSDSDQGDESGKKMKLSNEHESDAVIEAEPVPPKELKKLCSFKKFMQDKGLTALTRDQLEELVVQKMCECIMQKSEIGDLKLKIKAHEQMLDLLRKEVVLLSKQTRDLNIVHNKVIQNVTKIQESSDKPLVVPKITRSVGLQAIVREDVRRRFSTQHVTPAKTPAKVTAAPAAAATPIVVVAKTPQKNIAAKPLTNLQVKTTPVAAKQTKATMQQQPANAKASTGVIDLTDEDDKKITTTTAAVTATATNVAKNVTNKVNMINAPNGQKYVVMQNGQAVMVKLAPTNIVVSQPIRTIQPANGIVRTAAGNQAVRTTASAARTPARNRQPTNIVPTVRAKAPTATVTAIQPKYRHPAPLPNAPPIRDDLYSGKPLPPRPQLLLNKTTCGTGIILSWKMPYNLELFEEIASYQLYAYQETKSEPRTDSWGKIGDVKALELPMAVTLTQFAVGNRYYFAVRAVDILSRHGQFSEYQTILL